MRRPRHSATRATVAQALSEAMVLLDGGPGAVSVPAVARAVGRSADWVYLYLGPRDALLKRLVATEVARLSKALEQLAQQADPVELRVRQVLDLLVPAESYRASLWLLVLAGRQGLGGRGRLAQAITRALPQTLPTGIGGGLLGLLGEAIGTPWWTPDRQLLAATVTEMVLAAHFRSRSPGRARRQI